MTDSAILATQQLGYSHEENPTKQTYLCSGMFEGCLFLWCWKAARSPAPSLTADAVTASENQLFVSISANGQTAAAERVTFDWSVMLAGGMPGQATAAVRWMHHPHSVCMLERTVLGCSNPCTAGLLGGTHPQL